MLLEDSEDAIATTTIAGLMSPRPPPEQFAIATASRTLPPPPRATFTDSSYVYPITVWVMPIFSLIENLSTNFKIRDVSLYVDLPTSSMSHTSPRVSIHETTVVQVEKMVLDDTLLLHSFENEEQVVASTRSQMLT
nr:hypothetical protein Iba_scaffold489CG0110 [Ipomoea batatas]